MKVWIDIANSPHVTLFRPVVDELRRRGHDVLLTAWDRGQTLALAAEAWADVVVVGDSYRRSAMDKGRAIWIRARALADHVRPFGPDMALGHNSYAQIVAGRLLGTRVVTAMDYEHQPANHLAFRLAHRIVLPEAIPLAAVRRFGARPSRVVRYGGLKEEIALATFRPDPDFRQSIGIDEDDVLVVARPPAEGALYHRHPNPLFDRVVARLGEAGARVLLSPRTRGQGQRYRDVPGVEVLTRSVSGPDLLFAADVVIGAGGTMTREAAILGTPTWSVFAGRPAAVDRELVRAGRLRVLDGAGECPPPLRAPRASWRPDLGPLRRFVDVVSNETYDAPAQPSAPAGMSPAA